VATVSPTFSAADPTLSPTPLSAPVIPWLDCGFVDLRGRERDLFAAGEDDRVDLLAGPREPDRLLGVRLDDAFVLRVGELPLRLVDPDRRAARCVLVWAMSGHLPQGCSTPALGTACLPTLRTFES
jgi:hypothetical protein